jgi:hypothetical protein
MKSPSPYSYRLLLENKQVGPFDRRTVVGMRIKKLVPKDTSVLRSDGLLMTVAQLLADKSERANPQTGQLNSDLAPLPSALWPTFLVHFGGGGIRTGALGFVGKGELRFQGEMLRLSGQRANTRWGTLLGSKHERIKIAITDIKAIDTLADACELQLTLRAGHPLATTFGKNQDVLLKLDSADDVQEVIELVRASV